MSDGRDGVGITFRLCGNGEKVSLSGGIQAVEKKFSAAVLFVL